jgi:hypothetical protein
MPLREGIHSGLTLQQYHNDPCPEPSLSSSIGELLLHRSPRHAWTQHPRLNKDLAPFDASRRMDLGSAAHCMLFGKANELLIINFDDYKGKVAREMRHQARLAGLVPILEHEYERARILAEIAAKYLADELGVQDAHDEACVVWKEEGDVWCRALIDRLCATLLCSLDYKTTELSAEPNAATLRIYRANYHFQAAFYERGLDTLNPSNVGRRRNLFLVQEVDPPYGCSLIQLDEGGMTIARKQVHAAIAMWSECMRSGKWPSYPRGIFMGMMPSWLEREWLMREMGDDRLTGEIGPDRALNAPARQLFDAS